MHAGDGPEFSCATPEWPSNTFAAIVLVTFAYGMSRARSVLPAITSLGHRIVYWLTMVVALLVLPLAVIAMATLLGAIGFGF